jgi:hypothetical protein
MKRCFTYENGDYPIHLDQRGKDRFVVTYGKQVDKGDYEYAARKLGEAIMHALACDGKLDNREKGER